MVKFTEADVVALTQTAKDILEAQSSLNDMYNPEWRSTYTCAKACLAAVGEFDELLKEIPAAWKFYGSAKPNNWGAALEEYIDVVHFMASAELIFDQVDSEVIQNDINKMLEDITDEPLGSMDETLDLIRQSFSPGYFGELLLLGCIAFKITPEQLLVAYLHKNKKNQLRAKAGAATRDVSEIKDLELSTFDYMYQHGFISMTSEEYTLMLDGSDV